MPKNIVVFSDGTGQEGGKLHNSNVYKLFNMIEDRTARQISFYDRGLGTGGEKFLGLMFGVGISRNVKDCYQFIFENYNAGDRIFLFGFSRGAATVRSLSGFIHLFGILPKSRPELIGRAYRIYQIRDTETRERKAADFIERNHTMWCRIKFLGVWDTVTALGVTTKLFQGLNFYDFFSDFQFLKSLFIFQLLFKYCFSKIPFFRHKFHNFRLSRSVENAYQALSIDDDRRLFHPLLWEPGIESYQTMRQVWFCGSHSDVGGGYPEQEVSDISLVWMMQKAVHYGLKIYPGHKVKIRQNVNGEIHDPREGLWARFFYRKEPRSWDARNGQQPTLHKSVLERRLNQHNTEAPEYRPWIFDEACEIEPWDPSVSDGREE
ncbi:MAG: DUF2235 domain-containing protein [Pirellulales bacterium]|nr:DUF2235 domain-containing protein [Pirellulales bacterium]